jgi:RimJ/RimL family protein N-acetyltransferase
MYAWRSKMNSRLYLRAFEYDDLTLINKLRNDDELFEFTCGNKFHTSLERDKKWIEDKIFNNSTQLYLMLCIAETKIPIGYVAATNIDYINRKAQYGGIVISWEFKGKGYGTEASKLLLKHIFEELGINMVYGYWREDHVASLRMAEKVGFKIKGLIQDFVFKQNKFHNAYICSLLKSEYDLI